MFVTARDAGTEGFVAATTDASGRFEIPLFSASPTLWARHGNFAGSELVRVRRWRTHRPLEIRLRPAGAELRGTVIDSAGDPIKNAIISTTPQPFQPSVSVRSSASGKFVIDQLAPGRHRLTVVARGYVTSRNHAVAEPEGPSITVTLERGARVVGRITPRMGERGLQLVARWRAGRHDSPHRGRFAPSSPVLAGCFTLDSVPRCTGAIEVFERCKPRVVLGRVELTALAGPPQHVSVPLLEPVRSRVKIVNHVNAPAPHVRLALFRHGTVLDRQHVAVVSSGEDGIAVFDGIPRRTYKAVFWNELVAMGVGARQTPGLLVGQLPAHVVQDFVLGADVSVRLPRDFRRVTRVSGRADRRARDRALHLRLVDVDRSRVRRVDWEADGSFVLDAVPFGRYLLQVGHGQHWYQLGDAVTIAGANDGDLGTVRVPRFGRLVVRATYGRWITIRNTSRTFARRLRIDVNDPVCMLAPSGDYEVLFASTGLEPGRKLLHVAPAGITRVLLPHEAGERCLFRLRKRRGMQASGHRLPLTVTRVGGTTVAARTAPFDGAAWLHETWLVPGKYVIAARAHGVIVFERQVTVTNGGPNEFVIEPKE